MAEDHTRIAKLRPLVPPALGAIVLVAAVPVILLPRFDDRGRGAFDQINYHQRVIETFARALPAPDLGDYLSATTPGYHLILAVPRAAGVSIRGLRLIGAGFAVMLVVVVGAFVTARAPPGSMAALAICLPLATSMYVMHSAMWLLPDNAAWLGVAGILAITLSPRIGASLYVGAGVALACLVFVRQIHLWAAAPIWIAAWLGSNASWPDALRPTGKRTARLLKAALATLPAFVIVGAFAALWGGLTPPLFQERYTAPNLATPAFILALLGIFSAFYGAWVGPAFVDLARTRPTILVGALALGAIVAIAPETSYDQGAGRWSGLWNVAAKLPTLADRSPLIIVLAIAGAGACAAWLHALPVRSRLIVGAALVGFVAAQTATHEAWQRYNGPFLLILLPMMCALARPMPMMPRLSRVITWARIAGPLLLAALCVALTVLSLANARPVRVIPVDELRSEGAGVSLHGGLEGSRGPAEMRLGFARFGD